jgi:6-phosphogluconolactonase
MLLALPTLKKGLNMKFVKQGLGALLLVCTGLMMACGGGGGVGGGSDVPTTGSVNATVSGLRTGGTATLVVTSGNSSKTVSITANGQAVVASGLPAGASYSVAVSGKPDFQTCALSGSSGTVQAGVMATFSMVCTENPYLAYVVNTGSNDVSAYTIQPDGSLASVGAAVPARADANSIAVSPSGKFAYVANTGSRSISIYSIHPSTGVLSTTGTLTLTRFNDPKFITLSPNGKFAYVANGGANNVLAYNVNPSTGALSTVTGSPFTAGNTPRSIAVSPDSKFVYVANQGGTVWSYAIDSLTGTLSTISRPVPAGSAPYSIAVSPNGKFAYVANYLAGGVSAYSVDTTTGVLAPLEPTASFETGSAPGFVTVSPNNRFAYVANFADSFFQVLGINSNTGALSSAQADVASGRPAAIAADPTGKFVYVTSGLNNNVSAFSVDATTGMLTPIGSAVATGLSPASIVITRGP